MPLIIKTKGKHRYKKRRIELFNIRKNMKFLMILLMVLMVMPKVQASQCTNNFTLVALEQLKKNDFEISSPTKRNATAIKLLSCLSYHDPKVRDGIVFNGISKWLRSDLLDQRTTKLLFHSLIKILDGANTDVENYEQPFAALVFSEVVRVDRVTPYLSADDRQKAVNVSTKFMKAIEDYRGFNDIEGWRHSVAHTSDIFLQLAINKNISKSQRELLLSAIQAQINPANLHFYNYGEPKRLATAFLYIVLQGDYKAPEISKFLESVTTPAPFGDWASVYSNNKGLAKLHNTRGFIYSILAITGKSKNPKLQEIQPTLLNIIKKLG
jgi:hypothetical protein